MSFSEGTTESWVPAILASKKKYPVGMPVAATDAACCWYDARIAEVSGSCKGIRMMRAIIMACLASLFFSACGILPSISERSSPAVSRRSATSEHGQEVVLYALSLVDTGYRFGGKNPEAGLDCSGMVSYVYNKAIGMKLTGSAANIARQGQPVGRGDLRPGDLVFFNTSNAPFSHVGIYIGGDRFIHAPSTRGRVRIDQMNARYYATRYETARAYLDLE